MSIEELKEIIFQNRCVFLNTKQPCLSDDMSAYGCEECSNKIVDEFVEKIRADERKKAEQDFQNGEYWNEYLEKVLADERTKVLDEVDKYLRELSDIKSGCGEWIEHHDAELMRRTREQEMNFVERKCKELGIDYIQIYTCDSAD